MAEIHVTTSTGIVVHNPGQHPLPAGAGQPVTKTGTAVSGQVPNSTVVVRNPA